MQGYQIKYYRNLTLNRIRAFSWNIRGNLRNYFLNTFSQIVSLIANLIVGKFHDPSGKCRYLAGKIAVRSYNSIIILNSKYAYIT